MENRNRALPALVVLALALGAAGYASRLRAGSYTPVNARAMQTDMLTRDIDPSTPDAERVRRGQYLVRAGDCASCHTKAGGAFMAGGYPLPTPFGTLYGSNLTPEPETGLGKWTADQFYRALHDGMSPHGPLYPAMPYPYMTRVTRADADAIFAYLKTLPPVASAAPENDLSFPFNIRPLVHGWNMLFFDRGEFTPDAGQSPEWNRGAYLVKGLGHCEACHTPKNALAGDHADRALQGGLLDNWVAPDLSANPRTGLGKWNEADIIEYLKTGRNAHANAGGSMSEVVSFSTSLLDDADLRAIAVYLKSLPARSDTKIADADSMAMKRGAAVFSDACTGCHREGGKGQARLFPPLGGNAAAQQDDATGLLHILLAGDRTGPTATRPSALSMPSFAWKLDDRQIADVATYVRNSWGNRAAPVEAGEVAKLREKLRLSTARPGPYQDGIESSIRKGPSQASAHLN